MPNVNKSKGPSGSGGKKERGSSQGVRRRVSHLFSKKGRAGASKASASSKNKGDLRSRTATSSSSDSASDEPFNAAFDIAFRPVMNKR